MVDDPEEADGLPPAFDEFDPRKVARYDAAKRRALMADAGIVRNRLKIDSAVTNAARFSRCRRSSAASTRTSGASSAASRSCGRPRGLGDVPARTEESDALSKDLKKRGMNFVGSTILYAFLQATGLVNDHVVGCWRAPRKRVSAPAGAKVRVGAERRAHHARCRRGLRRRGGREAVLLHRGEHDQHPVGGVVAPARPRGRGADDERRADQLRAVGARQAAGDRVDGHVLDLGIGREIRGREVLEHGVHRARPDRERDARPRCGRGPSACRSPPTRRPTGRA